MEEGKLEVSSKKARELIGLSAAGFLFERTVSHLEALGAIPMLCLELGRGKG